MCEVIRPLVAISLAMIGGQLGSPVVEKIHKLNQEGRAG